MRKVKEEQSALQTIRLPYFHSFMELHVERGRLAGILQALISTCTAAPDACETVRAALRHPIGSPPLAELVRGKKKILIVTSDHTRPVPSRITLPVLTQEILEAEPSAEITVLIGTGLHRATTREEQIEKFGADMVERFRFVVHDAFNAEEMRFVKILPSGARFEVNRLVVESDVVITEGFIEPHFFAGFSGGRKSILPGVSSAATVAENHCAKAIAHPLSKGGVLHGNIINRDMVEAARAVKVAFTLNVTLNGEKQIIGAYAGDLEAAHEAGCAAVTQLSRAQAIQGDIVVVSMGGYPLDQNLYQSPKAVSTAAECAAEGAPIILVASCADGFGGTYFEQLITGGSPLEILARLLETPPSDTLPEQWCAQIYANILLHHPVIVVTDNLTDAQLARAGMLHAATPDAALAMARRLRGEDASVVVIPDGVSVLILKEEAREKHG